MDVNTPRAKNMHHPDLIDQYVSGLGRMLPMRRDIVERTLEEVEGHLRSVVEREVRNNSSSEDAQRQALELFGSQEAVATEFRFAHRRTRIAWVWESLRKIPIIDRCAFAIVVLIVPSNLEMFRGGMDIAAPLALSAVMLGLLPGFVVQRHERALGAVLAGLLMVAVLSFIVLDVVGSLHTFQAYGANLCFGPTSLGAPWYQWSWYCSNVGGKGAQSLGVLLSLRDAWSFTCLIGLSAVGGVFGSALGRMLRWAMTRREDRNALVA